MQVTHSPDSSWQQRTLWLGVNLTGALVLGASLVQVIFGSLSITNAAVLGVSAFVAVLISRYEIKIPGTRLSFSPKDVVAFWGIMWLGIAGGVLLSAAASWASHNSSGTSRRRLVRSVASDVLVAALAAIAFHFVVDRFVASAYPVGIGQVYVPTNVLVASLVMVIVYFANRAALVIAQRRTEIATDTAIRPTVSPGTTGLGFGLTLCLFVAFTHFGIEFGLIFIPLAIVWDLAYKVHLRSVADQTKLISEASRIHLATVEALATAIDAREQVGVGHVRRTQIYAVGIGSLLGLGNDEINALRTGALLHDIGKLAVPDHILNKPGVLTPAEREKIKTHSSVGASILDRVGFSYPVVPTVKHHHEFWNGKGYPDGLAGGNIPLTARILAIADAYDTLRVERPYRKAVPREEACSFLRIRSGSQFDPRLVDLFLRNLRIFEAEIESEELAYDTDCEIGSAAPSLVPGQHQSYVEQIKRANREVFTLYSLARDFSSELDLDEILTLFTQKVRELIPFDTLVVYLLDESNEYAIASHVDGRNAEAFAGRRVEVGEGATGAVLMHGTASHSVDPDFDFEYSNLELRGEYCSMAALPLLADQKLVGTISLYSSELHGYQAEHLRLLEAVSRIAADAICRSQEYAVTENYALTDPMTGLPNARNLQMQFEKEVKRAERNEGSFQLLVLDLDGFKTVNDTFGHKSGDRMLKEIAGVIKGQLREYDFLARYGGDEFVALVPDTDNNDVLELAKRIEDAVQNFALVLGDDQTAKVGVSIGTACYPIHGETFDQVIVSADKAMYLTKGFHRKRASGRTSDPTIRVPVVIPEEIVEFATVKGESQEGLILEIDETHIVSSSAVN